MKIEILKDNEIKRIMEILDDLHSETSAIIASNDKDAINAHNDRIRKQCDRLYSRLIITL